MPYLAGASVEEKKLFSPLTTSFPLSSKPDLRKNCTRSSSWELSSGDPRVQCLYQSRQRKLHVTDAWGMAHTRDLEFYILFSILPRKPFCLNSRIDETKKFILKDNSSEYHRKMDLFDFPRIHPIFFPCTMSDRLIPVWRLNRSFISFHMLDAFSHEPEVIIICYSIPIQERLVEVWLWQEGSWSWNYSG